MTRGRIPLAVLAILAAVAVTFCARAQTQPSTSSDHVVIISLDGFGGWALDDPHLPVPTLRRLAAHGAIAKGMRPVNPTVTWANHTSIVTGVTPAKHGVIFNGLLIQKPGAPPQLEPWRDRKELVRVRTLYDAAHERGITTAQVDWVAIQNAPTITWEFPERPAPDGAIARELVKTNVISEADLESFPKHDILWRDHIWTLAAAHILREHRPGLMLFHLLNLDSTEHRYGPRTPAAQTAMAHLDSQVQVIIDTLERTGLTASTTVFVVSDHGFKTVKRRVYPNAALAKAGLIRLRDGIPAETQTYAVSEGGTALVYVTAPDPSGELLKRTRQALSGIEGIERIVEPAEYPRYGLPLPSVNDQMGALLLVAKDGYAFSDAAGGEIVGDASVGSFGAHGYPNTDSDLRALFIASGPGIRSGVVLDAADNLDIAPTAAELLGVQLNGVDGKVMKEIRIRP
jgi:predicted AlkP superfamily pyrophosphatase or phosphodiesterase